VASELVAGGADVRVSCGDQAGDLHDEHDRVVEHDAAEGDEESLAVPERRGGLQADVLGAEEHQQAVDDAYKELERGDEPVRYTVRGAGPDGRTLLKLTYTESCLGSNFFLYILLIYLSISSVFLIWRCRTNEVYNIS
jgi:hypothetical protein